MDPLAWELEKRFGRAALYMIIVLDMSRLSEQGESEIASPHIALTQNFIAFRVIGQRVW